MRCCKCSQSASICMMQCHSRPWLCQSRRHALCLTGPEIALIRCSRAHASATGAISAVWNGNGGSADHHAARCNRCRAAVLSTDGYRRGAKQTLPLPRHLGGGPQNSINLACLRPTSNCSVGAVGIQVRTKMRLGAAVSQCPYDSMCALQVSAEVHVDRARETSVAEHCGRASGESSASRLL